MKENVLSLMQRLDKCNRNLATLFSEAIQDVQISVKQYIMLKAIKDAEWLKNSQQARTEQESKKDRQNVVSSDLAKYLDLDPTTVCRNLKLLQKRGLVESKRSAVSLRERNLSLTKEGLALCQKAEKLLAVQSETFSSSDSIEDNVKAVENWIASLSAK